MWLLRWLLLLFGRRSAVGRFGLRRGPLLLGSCCGFALLVAGGGRRLVRRGRLFRRRRCRLVACGGWLRLVSGLRLGSGCRCLALAVVRLVGGFGAVRCLRVVVALGVEAAGGVFFFSVLNGHGKIGNGKIENVFGFKVRKGVKKNIL